MDELRRRWDELLARVGLEDGGLFDEVVARYREPHRRYHTVEHLAAVVEATERRAGGLAHGDAVALAAWFHDVVYDPRAAGGENERASAALARRELGARGAPEGLVARVEALVLATIDHRPPDAPDLAAEAKALVDADLAVLSAPPEAYDRYAGQIREEYAFVPDDAFAAGRARVLRSLLDAGLPDAARANLQRELERLAPSRPG